VIIVFMRPVVFSLRRSYYWVVSWAACVLTGSRACHVAIILHDRACETSVSGSFVYEPGPWLRAQQSVIDGFYSIPDRGIPGGMEWLVLHCQLVGRRKLPLIVTECCRFLNFVTAGTIPFWHCCTPALIGLQAMGYDVPQWVQTPGALKRWLDAQGLDYCRDTRPTRIACASQ
jgi:hypothetical protein